MEQEPKKPFDNVDPEWNIIPDGGTYHFPAQPLNPKKKLPDNPKDILTELQKQRKLYKPEEKDK